MLLHTKMRKQKIKPNQTSMKNTLLVVAGMILLSCDPTEKPIVNSNKPSFDVNFYIPDDGFDYDDVPQLTLRDQEVQITALGDLRQGIQQGIEKLYISDSETSTEWIVLPDDSNRPAFFYAVNSSTKEKLPFLYWSENISADKYVLRFYE